jgi:hypothetical protein
MDPITFDLLPGMSGPAVVNLQDGLRLMLERGSFGLPDPELEFFLTRLAAERLTAKYNDITIQLVRLFQKKVGIDNNGEVRETTAVAMNSVLDELGAFPDEPPAPPREYVIAGRVLDPSGTPSRGLRIVAYHTDNSGSVRLGADQSDGAGRYTIQFTETPALRGVILVVEAENEQGQVVARSDRRILEELLTRIDLSTRPPAQRPERRAVQGRVILDHGAPAAALFVRLYRLDFGGQSQQLTRAVTGADGRYTLEFNGADQTIAVEVRAEAPNGTEVKLSKPLNLPARSNTISADLVAPGDIRPVTAEYGRLSAALTPVLGDMQKLAAAKEDAGQRDLTALNAGTGWDARSIALAATAQHLKADQQVKLDPEPLYGLFRAGLPYDKQMLAQVDPEDVGVALQNLVANNIVSMTPDQITAFKTAFTTFAKEVRLSVPAPGSQTTYGELLGGAGVGADADKFAGVFLKHRGAAVDLWKAARDAKVPETAISKLQWQGKLAFLAGNSGKVTAHLMTKLQGATLHAGLLPELTSPAALVDADLYDAEKWKAEVSRLAANEAELAALIPAAYQAKKVADRLESYAADMARKVRISYPTEVVARMVQTDKIPLNGGKDVTVKFLQAAAPQGFKLGHTPVEQFVAAGMTTPDGMPQADFDQAKQEVKTLHRVYQITPTNEAMAVLMKLGLTSAFDVTALPEHQFYRLYDQAYATLYGKLPRPIERELLWRKAQQVSSTTYTIFGAAQRLDTDLAVPALTGTAQRREEDRQGLKDALKGYPTIEELFGTADFCECSHCRSVLSPAAYLVDLLQFVEAEHPARAAFLSGWKGRNNEKTYAEMGFLDPYDALVQRRPDLPHIPLTCENTNVALPYVDVVNEILEFYAANGGLTKEAMRDTGDATSAELLAEPQNIIVEAYRKLLDERYPIGLPFDLWLETVREFCAYTETPLHEVLEIFRGAGPAAPVFIESLGLSPAERAILADPDPQAAWWKLYGYDAEDPAKADLSSAGKLARRLGVPYQDLARLVTTAFVNPKLGKLGVLYRLPASIAELKTFLAPANQQFLTANRDLLGPELTPQQQERVEALTNEQWNLLTDLGGFADRVRAYADRYARTVTDVMAELSALTLGDVLVLADPDAGCDFDLTTLRLADGSPAGPDVFLRLNLFVRLWRELGWDLDETDRALTAFVPANAPYTTGNYAKKPLDTALTYLSHLKALDEELTVARPSRARLLTLWTDIPTTGENPLYAQLFLTRSVLKTDAIFDHPHGDYLAEAWVAQQGQGRPPEFVLVKGHLPAIRSALGLTSDEVTAILKDAGASIDTAKLTIANLSVLHRYGMLAKALRLPVADLLTLKALSGRDPFRRLDPEPLTSVEKDYPYTETLAFIRIAERVRGSGLTVADLDYLLRRRYDEAGPRRPDRPAALTLLTRLADGIRAIRAEHAEPAGAQTLTEGFLHQKLALLLSPVHADTVLRMVRGEDDTNAATTRAFFDNVLKKGQVRRDGDAGFLNAGDYPALFQPLKPVKKIEPTDTPEQVEAKRAENEAIAAKNRATLLQRRTQVARAFLPVLQNRLIRGLAVQTLAADAGAEPALVEQLLTDEDLLSVTVGGSAGRPLIEAFTAAASDGIQADFYLTPNATGDRQDTSPRTPEADTAARRPRVPDAPALPAANSARFRGYLAVRAAGPHRFFVNLAKNGAKARLRLDHLPEPLFLDKTATSDNAEFGFESDEFADLATSVPYGFSFELDALNGGAGRLTVQGEATPRGPLSQLALYPADGIEQAETALVRLRAALELLARLTLTQREITHLAGKPAKWGNLDLSQLPTAPVDDATALFGWFLRLAEYAELRRDLTGGTDGLVDVFEAGVDGAEAKLSALTRRPRAVVHETASSLLTEAERAFADDRPVRRLWDALRLVERLGATATAIKRWTAIVTPGTGSDARFTIARELKESVKARFDPETWQRVAQPIFDRLRRRQRDALVAAIMHRQQLTRAEELYEYFLVDPGMEPVVQTSRIRLAIGSVQLFIQRCLLNLEPKVHPSAVLNAEQWEWMKRYRAWEANRKIFLFPENWLEPEFRDDKTHLFTELESTLMENDVSADLVEGAFATYLGKLAALAKLDIVAMHLEAKPDFAKNTLHVFGRTHSTPHQYFHRRYANRMWTPWEPVAAEIEGDHLAPVVWRDRLFLFWLTFVQTGRPSGGPADADDLTAMPQLKLDIEAQLHWSEYTGGAWQTHESGGYTLPAALRVRVEGQDRFDPQSVFVHVTVVDPPDIGAENPANLADAGVYINLGGPINKAFYLASRNSIPIGRGVYGPPPTPWSVETSDAGRRPTSYVGTGGKLTVSFKPRIISGPGQLGANVTPSAATVLETAGSYTLLPVNNRVTLGVSADAIAGAQGTQQQKDEVRRALEAAIGEIESLIKPVFFQDAHQVLFVEPQVVERTVQEWEEWVTRTPVDEPEAPGWHKDPQFWEKFVKPLFPDPRPGDPPGPVIKFPYNDSRIQPKNVIDWLSNPGTGLFYNGHVIGKQGLAPITVVPLTDLPAATEKGAAKVTVHPGSGLAADTAVIFLGGDLEKQQDLTPLSKGMNIVGGAGLNAALRENVSSFKTSGGRP